MKRKIFVALFCLGLISLKGQDDKVIFVTLDGLRWEELYKGIDLELAKNKEYNKDMEAILKKFDAPTEKERREKLMPFSWSHIAKHGLMIGNREEGSKVDLTNAYHFSYPGYSELFTGYADNERVNSNNYVMNPNVTVMEYLNQTKNYKNSVLAFGSWDMFNYIINDERSKVPVNAGYMHSLNPNPSEKERWINQMMDFTPKRWGTVRFDVFTHLYAMEALKTQKPKFMTVSYCEKDDFSHDGLYNQYITSANRIDQFIQELYEYTQQDPFYKDQTTFVITTDHGRGEGDEWKHHSNKIDGAGETWIMIFGPKTPKINPKNQFYNNQIAATIAKLLGEEFKSEQPIGKPIF